MRIYNMKRATGKAAPNSSLSQEVPSGQPIMPNVAPGNVAGQYGVVRTPGMNGYAQMQ